MTRPILIVDDSESVRAFARAALSPHYECVLASNGAEALEQARRERPEAIVLDLSMPVMGGDECLRRLKEDPALAGVPVVVVSSETHREAWCLEHGANAFVAKPVSAPVLLHTVERVLTEAARGRAGRAVLGVKAGGLEFAVPLEAVVRVLPSLATIPLPWGPSYLRESVSLEAGTAVVLDVARRFGTEPQRALEDRMLVVTSAGRLVLRVDEVDDPEELGEGTFQTASAYEDRLGQGLMGFAVSGGRTRPVMMPEGLLSASLRDQLRTKTEGQR